MMIIANAKAERIEVPINEQEFFNAHFDLMVEDLKECKSTELWIDVKPFDQ